MTRFIIIGNGEIDNFYILRKTIKKNDIIIAVDGGADYAKKISIRPDYIIGDMDSINNFPRNRKTANILKFSKEKNKTDSELALDFALDNNPSDIILFGMTSLLRIDHSINNIFLLKNLAEKGIRHTLFVNSFTRVSAVKRKIILQKKYGRSLSLIPLSQKVNGIVTKGLKYKLNKETLFMNKSRGISNIITENKAEITFIEGILLVIQIKGTLS
ncbi:MAG: thiamine diphosphokinase [bacterium]